MGLGDNRRWRDQEIAAAGNGRMVAWIEHPDNFVLDRWSSRVHESRDGGRSWREIRRTSERAETDGLNVFKEIRRESVDLAQHWQAVTSRDELWRTVWSHDDAIAFEVQHRANNAAPW